MNKGITLMIGSMLLFACGSGDAASDTTAGDTSAVDTTAVDTTAASNTPWRVVVDEHQTGGPVDPGTRTATDAEAFDELWALMGRGGEQPSVDFDEEVVVAYAMSYPSGCEFPFIDLEIDETDAIITASYAGNEPAMCADDENQYLVIVGIDREGLSHPRYEVATSISGRTATLEL